MNLLSDLRGFFRRHSFLFKTLGLTLLMLFLVLLLKKAFSAEPPTIVLPKIQIGEEVVKGPRGLTLPLEILAAIAVLSLAPYLFIIMTPFVRVLIVLSFLRSAMGTQQVPSNQILIAFALFLTFYILAPVLHNIEKEALTPLVKGKIKRPQAVSIALKEYKKFMLAQTREEDLVMFAELSKIDLKKTKPIDIPFYVLIPAYLLSEIKTAFIIGFLIYLPFLVIDMIVGSVLMAMGMFMMSPMTISLPFKLLLFVMIDGWKLITYGLVSSYHYPK